MNTKFKEGKKYYGRSLVDHDTKIVVKIVKRTPTTVEIKMDPKNGWPTDQTRFKIKTSSINGVTREYIRLGRYSLAPIISSDRPVN